MASISGHQKRRAIDALVGILPAGTPESLEAESILAIMDMLGCLKDEAEKILNDFQNRQLIRMETAERDDESGARTPALRWCWRRFAARGSATS